MRFRVVASEMDGGGRTVNSALRAAPKAGLHYEALSPVGQTSRQQNALNNHPS